MNTKDLALDYVLGNLSALERTEVARAIFGADKLDEGEIYLDGSALRVRLPSWQPPVRLLPICHDTGPDRPGARAQHVADRAAGVDLRPRAGRRRRHHDVPGLDHAVCCLGTERAIGIALPAVKRGTDILPAIVPGAGKCELGVQAGADRAQKKKGRDQPGPVP